MLFDDCWKKYLVICRPSGRRRCADRWWMCIEQAKGAALEEQLCKACEILSAAELCEAWAT
jgi:hypothetical protein